MLDLLANHSVTDALPRAHQAVQQSGHGEDLILVLEARALLNSARLLDDRLAALHRTHSSQRSRLGRAESLFAALIEGLPGESLRTELAPDDLTELFSSFCDGRITITAVEDALHAGESPSTGSGNLLDIAELAGDVASGIGKVLMHILD